jgi:hypothetical protein
MRMAYVVSSHITYTAHSVPRLLASMQRWGVPKDDVFVVVTDSGREIVQKGPACTFWYVTHNSLNFSPYVELVNPAREKVLAEYDYVFFLMCTTEVGPRFVELTNSFQGSPDVVGGHRFNGSERAQCDFGAYKISYVRSQERLIRETYLNCTGEVNIQFEGCMALYAPVRQFYPWEGPTMEKVAEPQDVYGVGTPRITERYHAIDVTKYKANWGQNGTRIVGHI